MVDIDEDVCKFCEQHLPDNKAAFADPRLVLINDDAHKQLVDYEGTFDVIIGDLADPIFGGPCYQMYTDDFYKNVVCKKLSPGGIFVTQSGPCGLLSASMVFSSIHNTLKASFPKVVPYCCHIPSFADEWVRPLVPRPSRPAHAVLLVLLIYNLVCALPSWLGLLAAGRLAARAVACACMSRHDHQSDVECTPFGGYRHGLCLVAHAWPGSLQMRPANFVCTNSELCVPSVALTKGHALDASKLCALFERWS